MMPELQTTTATKENIPENITVKSHCQWLGGAKTQLTVRKFHPFHMDEPKEMGGTDTAPSPLEYMMASLCGCSTMMITTVAKEQNFNFSGVEVDAAMTLDPRGIMGTAKVDSNFKQVEHTIKINSSESSAKLKALQDEVERRCPAINLFKNSGAAYKANWNIDTNISSIH